MGFDKIEIITAGTANPVCKDKNLYLAKTRIEEVVKNWLL